LENGIDEGGIKCAGFGYLEAVQFEGEKQEF